MRVLVCGGRDFGHPNTLEEDFIRLTLYQNLSYKDVIIEGEARGVDLAARRFAEEHGLAFEAYPADWDKHGKAAGFIRNKEMLTKGKPDIVIAFPGGRGTAMMVELAKKAGVKVIEVAYEPLR